MSIAFPPSLAMVRIKQGGLDAYHAFTWPLPTLSDMLAIHTLFIATFLTLGVAAQEKAGTWFFNASTPATDPKSSGCVILAQLTNSTSPPTLESLYPICPSTTPNPSDPSTGVGIPWPISTNNRATNHSEYGLRSSLAIYAQVQHKVDRTDVYMAQAGCVLVLDKDQVQYILGRSLTWNNDFQLLWDITGNGFIATKDGSANMTCGQDATVLTKSLWLPDPYVLDSADATWKSPIQLEVPQPKTRTTTSSTSGSSGRSTAVASSQTQVMTSDHTLGASQISTVITRTSGGSNASPTTLKSAQVTGSTISVSTIGRGLLAETSASSSASASASASAATTSQAGDASGEDDKDAECDDDDDDDDEPVTVTKTVTVTDSGNSGVAPTVILGAQIRSTQSTSTTSTIGGGLFVASSSYSSYTSSASAEAKTVAGEDTDSDDGEDCEGDDDYNTASNHTTISHNAAASDGDDEDCGGDDDTASNHTTMSHNATAVNAFRTTGGPSSKTISGDLVSSTGSLRSTSPTGVVAVEHSDGGCDDEASNSTNVAATQTQTSTVAVTVTPTGGFSRRHRRHRHVPQM